jgi:hypothetical protein
MFTPGVPPSLVSFLLNMVVSKALFWPITYVFQVQIGTLLADRLARGIRSAHATLVEELGRQGGERGGPTARAHLCP